MIDPRIELREIAGHLCNIESDYPATATAIRLCCDRLHERMIITETRIAELERDVIILIRAAKLRDELSCPTAEDAPDIYSKDLQKILDANEKSDSEEIS